MQTLLFVLKRNALFNNSNCHIFSIGSSNLLKCGKDIFSGSLMHIAHEQLYRTSTTVPKYSEKNISSSAFKSAKKSTSKVSIDSLGAWDNNYELPLLMETSIEQGKPIPHIEAEHIGYSTNIGKRNYQEDRYFIKDFGSKILCCAVFDGHGGEECSNFCVQNIEAIIEPKIQKKDANLEDVLHDTILELNSSFAKHVENDEKARKSGSTCTVCLLRKGLELYIGHVGDSRVLLSRNGAPRRLTVDHCPSNLAEKNRIKQSGGKVITDNIGRHMVNGMLSMSRSIGDFHLKPYGVSALPDTRKYQIKHAKDSFILLTTDGINYVLNDEEISNVINYAQDPLSASAALTEQALSMSSEDNLTALVIPLGAWGQFAKSAASMFYSFGIGRNMCKSSRFG